MRRVLVGGEAGLTLGRHGLASPLVGMGILGMRVPARVVVVTGFDVIVHLDHGKHAAHLHCSERPLAGHHGQGVVGQALRQGEAALRAGKPKQSDQVFPRAGLVLPGAHQFGAHLGVELLLTLLAQAAEIAHVGHSLCQFGGGLNSAARLLLIAHGLTRGHRREIGLARTLRETQHFTCEGKLGGLEVAPFNLAAGGQGEQAHQVEQKLPLELDIAPARQPIGSVLHTLAATAMEKSP